MKKTIAIILLFLLISSSNASGIIKQDIKTLEEGIYRVSTFITPLDKINYVRNTSEKDLVYLMVFDKNSALVQTLRLEPKSEKFRLVQLDPTYTIAIIDDGRVVFSTD